MTDMEARLGSLERGLLEKLARDELVARNVNELQAQRLTVGQRVADRFAATIGGWRFIIAQSCVLVVWLVLNVAAWVRHWDPYPFILLNLVLSFQAAYAAPIIMMSQNRQEAKDRLRAEHDYEVNVKAELEIGELNEKLDRLRQTQWEELLALQRQQLTGAARATERGPSGTLLGVVDRTHLAEKGAR
jgi:uncharacterized membrane protein